MQNPKQIINFQIQNIRVVAKRFFSRSGSIINRPQRYFSDFRHMSIELYERASQNLFLGEIVPVRAKQTKREEGVYDQYTPTSAEFVATEPGQLQPEGGFGTLSEYKDKLIAPIWLDFAFAFIVLKVDRFRICFGFKNFGFRIL